MTTTCPAARTAAYAALVQARKSCRACQGLVNPASHDGGIHDSDHIGPWSLWQGNLNADLVIVGQDGATGVTSATTAGARHRATRPMKRCASYSAPSASTLPGLPPPKRRRHRLPHQRHPLFEDRGMQAKVRAEWFSNCGARFLRPTIELIASKVVVTLGEWA